MKIFQSLWARLAILGVIVGAALIAFAPVSVAYYIGATMGLLAPPIVIGGVIGWLAYSRRQWLAWTSGLTALWLAVLGVGYMKIASEAEIAAAPTQQAISMKGDEEWREAFLNAFQASCGMHQRNNPLNQRSGITEQQIKTYCACIATDLVAVISVPDMKYVFENNAPPESLTKQIEAASVACTPKTPQPAALDKKTKETFVAACEGLSIVDYADTTSEIVRAYYCDMASTLSRYPELASLPTCAQAKVRLHEELTRRGEGIRC